MREISAVVLDRIEKFVFTLLYLFFAWRMVVAAGQTDSLVTIMYLADQSIVLVFLLIRRAPKELSIRIGDWVAGVVGSLFPILIVSPSGGALIPEKLVILVLIIGFFIHLYAKLTLRRSFGVVAANRGVKLEGPYRLVRHPMYLGYMISHVGILSAGPNLINVVLVIGSWSLFFWRIVAEERLLSSDNAYQNLCRQTRWRLFPGVY